MVIGIVTKNVETSSVVGQVITFPMMFLSGTFFLISYMPTYIQNIAHALPLFYVIEGLNAVMIYNNYGQAAVELVVISVLTLGELVKLRSLGDSYRIMRLFFTTFRTKT